MDVSSALERRVVSYVPPLPQPWRFSDDVNSFITADSVKDGIKQIPIKSPIPVDAPLTP